MNPNNKGQRLIPQMEAQPEVYHYREMHELIGLAASVLTELAIGAVRERGRFTFVLSGGSTPRPLYRRLTASPHAELIPWTNTHLFWGDERMVPRDHKDSNYAMAFETLVSKVPVPRSNIHPIPVEAAEARQNADEYEQEIRGLFLEWEGKTDDRARGNEAQGFPVFDFVLLGMGGDGHTASLFPDSVVLNEREHWVGPVQKPGLAPFVPRVTLTLPVINRARCAAFLISGSEKAALAETILAHPATSRERYPAARVRPEGRLIWFIARKQG